MTILLTVLSGVCVFVAGQWILQFVIVPVQDARKTIAAVAHASVELADVTSNPSSHSREAQNQASSRLRKLSADLYSHLYLVRPYPLIARIFKLPSQALVLRASRSLIGLSNGVHSDRMIEMNAGKWGSVCRDLGIDIEPADRSPAE